MSAVEPAGPSDAAQRFSPIASLHLFVSLLGEVEHATPDAPGAFYNRLAEAVCRLGAMQRAVVFVYDDVARRVRVVGSHAVDIELFDGHILAIERAPIAGRALDLDQVVEGGAEELAAPYDTLLGIERLVCVPLAAGGRGFGVIVAERGEAPLSDDQREVLKSLGKISALALSARLATRHQVDGRHLADRIDLARDIHERVVQRVFGVVMALQSGALLDEADQRRAAAELGAALDDLREAMARPLAATPKLVTFTLREELGAAGGRRARGRGRLAGRRRDPGDVRARHPVGARRGDPQRAPPRGARSGSRSPSAATPIPWSWRSPTTASAPRSAAGARAWACASPPSKPYNMERP